MPNDSHRLDRFVEAQAGTYEIAVAELAAGRKRSHWMWFIFPQLRGLGRSPTAEFYGLISLEEARAYLDHPVLGPRLGRCTEVVLTCGEPSLHAIFGSPDDLKFRSSMTLFGRAAGEVQNPYRRALDRFCGGEGDAVTLTLLSNDSS